MRIIILRCHYGTYYLQQDKEYIWEELSLKLPDYPPISIFYFADKQFNTGIKEVDIEDSKVKIYDKEKTICDCIRLRNKVGTDVVKEAMQNYLKRKDKNISKLIKYAEIKGVKNIAKRYLEDLYEW